MSELTYYPNVEQCSEEWFELRRGILTASTIKHVITPAKMKRARNAKASSHLYELVAQRIAGYVDVSDFLSEDMSRGYIDEDEAFVAYSEHYSRAKSCGFVSNDKWGFTLGYSPDGLVGDEGQIEVKGRKHKYQVESIIANEMPSDYLIQVQTGLLVTEREWCDFISYSAGLPMMTLRIYPNAKVQAAIVEAASLIEAEVIEAMALYEQRITAAEGRFVRTERRRPEDEIHL
jgi:putative phage-type endonuclease